MPEVQDITLSVPDISCEHCVHAINTSLGGLTGVETVTTDIPTKTVHLRFHPEQVSLQEIEITLDGDCTLVCVCGRIRRIEHLVGGSHEYATRTD